MHSTAVHPITVLSQAGCVGTAMFVHDLKCLCCQ